MPINGLQNWQVDKRDTCATHGHLYFPNVLPRSDFPSSMQRKVEDEKFQLISPSTWSWYVQSINLDFSQEWWTEHIWGTDYLKLPIFHPSPHLTEEASVWQYISRIKTPKCCTSVLFITWAHSLKNTVYITFIQDELKPIYYVYDNRIGEVLHIMEGFCNPVHNCFCCY